MMEIYFPTVALTHLLPINKKAMKEKEGAVEAFMMGKLAMELEEDSLFRMD
jgi:hypothetical protein